MVKVVCTNGQSGLHQWSKWFVPMFKVVCTNGQGRILTCGDPRFVEIPGQVPTLLSPKSGPANDILESNFIVCFLDRC